MIEFFLTIIITFIATPLVSGEVNWCSEEMQCKGLPHTMCLYQPNTETATCKNIVDVQTTVGRQNMLNYHNEYRNKLAGGEVNGWPKAANMMEMTWDDQMESIALRWALQCIPGHDKCRKTQEFQSVGQNWGMSASSNEYPNAKLCFDGWVNEVNIIVDPSGLRQRFEGGKWGHFTQIAWASSYRVGCAEIHYEEDLWKKTVTICNYGPTGNVLTSPIYEEGEPASNCPHKRSPSKKYPNLCGPTDEKTIPDDETAKITQERNSAESEYSTTKKHGTEAENYTVIIQNGTIGEHGTPVIDNGTESVKDTVNANDAVIFIYNVDKNSTINKTEGATKDGSINNKNDTANEDDTVSERGSERNSGTENNLDSKTKSGSGTERVTVSDHVTEAADDNVSVSGTVNSSGTVNNSGNANEYLPESTRGTESKHDTETKPDNETKTGTENGSVIEAGNESARGNESKQDASSDDLTGDVTDPGDRSRDTGVRVVVVQHITKRVGSMGKSPNRASVGSRHSKVEKNTSDIGSEQVIIDTGFVDGSEINEPYQPQESQHPPHGPDESTFRSCRCKEKAIKESHERKANASSVRPCALLHILILLLFISQNKLVCQYLLGHLFFHQTSSILYVIKR